MTRIRSEWHASEDPDIESGTGFWHYDRAQKIIELPSFEHYNSINELLDVQYRHGRKDATNDIMKKLLILEEDIEKLT